MALRKIQFAKARAEGKKQMQIYCRLNCCKTNKSTKKMCKIQSQILFCFLFFSMYMKRMFNMGYINKQIATFVICIHARMDCGGCVFLGTGKYKGELGDKGLLSV